MHHRTHIRISACMYLPDSGTVRIIRKLSGWNDADKRSIAVSDVHGFRLQGQFGGHLISLDIFSSVSSFEREHFIVERFFLRDFVL